MNKIRNFFSNVGNWFTDNELNIRRQMASIVDGIDRIFNNILRLIIVGVIINIIACHFYPQFPERFPIIYGWFDGWLQLGEFALKGGLGAIYSLFTGNFSEFWANYNAEFQELWAQFVNWLSQIAHF